MENKKGFSINIFYVYGDKKTYYGIKIALDFETALQYLKLQLIGTSNEILDNKHTEAEIIAALKQGEFLEPKFSWGGYGAVVEEVDILE
jgi:hypothetical protein